MNNYIKNKSKTLFPNSCCFSMDGFKYKRINDKMNKLNESFKIFLDQNENKIIKSKKHNNSPNIDELFKKMISDSNDKIIKKYQKTFEKNKRKFLSAKEINQYRDKKRNLLKLMRNQKVNISLKKRITSVKEKNSSIINFTDSLYSNRDNNNNTTTNCKIMNRSILSSRSIKKPSTKNRINRIINLNNKKTTFRQRLYNTQQMNKSSKQTQNLSNYFNDISCIKSNEKEKDNYVNSYNKDNSTLNLIQLDKDNNYSNEEDFSEMHRKLTLRKLQLNITKFENSQNFLPNSNEIKKNKLQPYMFISKKYKYSRKADFFNLKKNKFRSLIVGKKKEKKEKALSAPRKLSFTNEYQLSLNKDNSYLNLTIKKKKSLLKKIKKASVNIKKKIKKGIKRDEKNIKFIKDLIKSFEGNHTGKIDINKEIRKEISNYQLEKRQFIFVGGRLLDVGHLSDVGISKFYM